MGLLNNVISRKKIIFRYCLWKTFFYHIIDIRDELARSSLTRSGRNALASHFSVSSEEPNLKFLHNLVTGCTIIVQPKLFIYLKIIAFLVKPNLGKFLILFLYLTQEQQNILKYDFFT